MLTAQYDLSFTLDSGSWSGSFDEHVEVLYCENSWTTPDTKVNCYLFVVSDSVDRTNAYKMYIYPDEDKSSLNDMTNANTIRSQMPSQLEICTLSFNSSSNVGSYENCNLRTGAYFPFVNDSATSGGKTSNSIHLKFT
jgi:hypothetical protein